MQEWQFMPSHKNDRSDLEIIADFVLNIANEHIRWNDNHQGNFVKGLMMYIVRNKIPHPIKQALLDSGITPEKYKTYTDIQDKLITIKNSDTNEAQQLSFEDFYTNHIENSPKKTKFHKNGVALTAQETSENYAKNAAHIHGGNCNECRDICESIWAECNENVRSAYVLQHIIKIMFSQLLCAVEMLFF